MWINDCYHTLNARFRMAKNLVNQGKLILGFILIG